MTALAGAAHGTLRRISRLELFLFTALLVPSLALGAFALVIGLIQSILTLALVPALLLAGGALAAFLIVEAIVWSMDLLYGFFRNQGQRVPQELETRLDTVLAALSDKGCPRIDVSRIRVNSADLTMGAHVRGAFFPRIVISGGLLIGALRGNKVAYGIISHELFHISHVDRLYFLFPFLWALNIAFTPLLWPLTSRLLYSDSFEAQINAPEAMGPLALIHIAVSLYVVSYISRRRELAADIGAAMVVGRQDYLQVLVPSTGKHNDASAGFFHPSLATRRAEITSPTRVGRPNPVMMVWMFIVFVSQGLEVGGLERIVYWCMGGLGIGAECWRFKLSENFALLD